MESYEWPLADEFLDRVGELDRLTSWWEGDDRTPQAIVGRRRVGKSWLLRRFAHGKPAEILVAEQVPTGAQLGRFADQLAPRLGVRPDLPDLPTLLRVLYRAARSSPLLVCIDELPWLLGTTEAEVRRQLSAVQAVLEEEAASSQLKLVVCGSQISVMSSLFGERNPLHGRLHRVELRPMDHAAAALFTSDLEPIEAFERFAIAGGMPMYLTRLARGEVRTSVCSVVLDPDGPLFNEGRAILDQELREPRVHFGILEQLSRGAKELNDIAQALRTEGRTLSPYLEVLADLELVSRRLPIGSSTTARSGHWQLDDPFLRFWFRFVFPFQNDLSAGLRTSDLFQHEVRPALAGHVSPVFESWCRSWVRTSMGDVASRVGPWWGKAASIHRRSGERSSEEIDIVGLSGSRVTLVGEAKWTARPMGVGVLDDLGTYKLPALADSALKVSDSPAVVLFARSGYTDGLRRRADGDGRITLVDVPGALQRETE